MNKGQRRSLKVRRVLLGSGCGLMSFLSLTSTWPRRLSLLFLIYISICSSQWFSEWESLTNMAITVCNNGQRCKILNIWNMKPEKANNDSCCIINYRQNVSLKKKKGTRKVWRIFKVQVFTYLFIFVLLSLLMATNVRSVNRLPARRSYSHLPDVLLRAVISIKLFLGALVRMLTLSL